MTTVSSAQPLLPRVYTDERFAGLHVTNDGSTQLSVIEHDPAHGTSSVVERFETQESRGSSSISEAFAHRQAKRYFDALAAESLCSIHMGLAEAGRDFADEQVLTADRVLDLWERAQAMPEGPEKEALLRQARDAAAQVESTASEIVKTLLEA